MTDDLDMAGLADFVSQEEAAYQAIVTGNDLILDLLIQHKFLIFWIKLLRET